MSYHVAFSYCSWGSQGKNTEVVCHSRLQWTTFWQTSPPWPIRLGWPHKAWLSFTELDTTVVLWSDWLVFHDYGFSVCFWCPLATPTVLLGFLLPQTWGISSRLLQQNAAIFPVNKGAQVRKHRRGNEHFVLITWEYVVSQKMPGYNWGAMLLSGMNLEYIVCCGLYTFKEYTVLTLIKDINFQYKNM